MSAREKAAGYVELSSRGCALLIGAYTSANRRALDYWKSVWQSTSRPVDAEQSLSQGPKAPESARSRTLPSREPSSGASRHASFTPI